MFCLSMTKIAILMTVTSITCALAQTPKLLKIPRVYNALITSDEALLPSQAYPAISPVIQGIHYPLTGFFAPGPPYQAIFTNNQIPNAVFLDNGLGSFSYAVRRESTPSGYTSSSSSSSSSSPDSRAFLERNKVDGETNQFSSIASSSDSDDGGNNNNNNPMKLSVQPIPSGLLNNDVSDLYRYHRLSSAKDLNENNFIAFNSSETNSNNNWKESDNNQQRQPVDTVDYVKNNRPTDPRIVDVLPPPLPITQRKPSTSSSANQKNHQEYPPPPGGFVV